jgi:hypothetical protein
MTGSISAPTIDMPVGDDVSTGRIRVLTRRQQRGAGVAAVLWVVAVGIIQLLPALVRGPYLGTTDLLGGGGLTAVPGASAYNGLAADQIRAFEPWAWLSWSQVHHGTFPLWNPHSGLGLPLLHNFQSSAFSLPMLIGYLMPQRYVYIASVISTMLIGGLGVLWFCRRLGLRLLPSTFAATAFVLSGSFSGWLGWPMAGTTAWLGWALGCVITLIRSPSRTGYLAGLAVVLAFMVYAGHPESLLITLVCIAAFIVAVLARRAIRDGHLRGCAQPVLALSVSGVAAFGLAAPLLLPGIEVVGRSTRGAALGIPISATASADLLLAGYHGYPVRGSNYFGPNNYYETAAYIGIVALVLVGLAVVHCWRESAVLGLGVVAVLCAALSYSVDVFRLLERFPLVQTVHWTRALMVLNFTLAVLAGIGLQVFLDHFQRRATRLAWWGTTLVLLLVVAIMWVFHARADMSSTDARIQARSFTWAGVQLGVLAFMGVVLTAASRHRSWFAVRHRAALTTAAALLLAVEAASLLTAAPSLWGSADDAFPVTPAVARLQAVVGRDRVGFTSCPSVIDVPPLGILAGTNAAYGVSEISAYDPILPTSYFPSYYEALGQPPVVVGRGGFCPSLSTATLARHFGVSFVLAAAGSAPPSGAIFKETIGGEDLYEVPGAGILTLQPEAMSPDGPEATVATLTGDMDDLSSLRTIFDVATPSILYVHVTNYDGWSATIDGRDLPLSTWAHTMLKASVPPGRHEIVLRYRPRTFTTGLVLAGASAIALGVVLLFPWWRGRLHPARPFARSPAEIGR